MWLTNHFLRIPAICTCALSQWKNQSFHKSCKDRLYVTGTGGPQLTLREKPFLYLLSVFLFFFQPLRVTCVPIFLNSSLFLILLHINTLEKRLIEFWLTVSARTGFEVYNHLSGQKCKGGLDLPKWVAKIGKSFHFRLRSIYFQQQKSECTYIPIAFLLLIFTYVVSRLMTFSDVHIFEIFCCSVKSSKEYSRISV
jgi:hypothetical protein